MLIRRLNEADAKALQQIRLRVLHDKDVRRFFSASLLEEAGMPLQSWREAAQETTKQVIVGAFEGHELMGMIGAREWEGDPDSETMYVKGAYVQCGNRGLGLCGQLYDEVEKWAREYHFTKAVMKVHEENLVGAAFFKKCGFIEEETIPTRFACGTANALRCSKRVL